jgi:aminopeptidase Y
MKQKSILVRIALFTLPSLVIVAAPGPRPTPGPSPSCDKRNNNTSAKLTECVTIEGVREHQAALQAIADAHGGTRVSGSPGYDASTAYVVERMEAAGYRVTVQPFEFQTFIYYTPAVLEQVAPLPAGPVDNNILSYSGSGDVTATVTALSAPPVDATPGCEAADFAGFPAGNIALISRGACTFAIKAENAYNAGAAGVIIYNNIAGEINGTLGNTFTLDIPVTSVTQAVGEQLAATPGLVMRLQTETFRGLATSYNVLAESRKGDPERVVIVGARLDSANAGPGINANGSGVAAVLETAEQMARVKPVNKVRFAFWGAEQSGLIGSSYYVNNLPAEDLARIWVYLNFDTIGSPNSVYFIYDGDDSDGVGGGPGPAGSDQIEKTFEAFYASRDLPYKGTDLGGGSDYAPFIVAGVPSGGIFTGATGIKTAEEAALWGGVAGLAYDPCYNLACDTYDNVNLETLDVNADAVAHATITYAMWRIK